MPLHEPMEYFRELRDRMRLAIECVVIHPIVKQQIALDAVPAETNLAWAKLDVEAARRQRLDHL